MKLKKLLLALPLMITTSVLANQKSPNIVVIYADDMGYGDIKTLNPESKIPTPNLNKLASEGISFKDAHSSSAICSPSRYALLTGKYHWRTRYNIVNSFGKPFFKDDDITLPSVLKANGYKTAAIGKWHLGFDWEFKNKPSGGKNNNYYLPEDIDWNQTVKGGPLDQGFDYYFGDGTINFPPYGWMENEKMLVAPTEVMKHHNAAAEPTPEGKWEFRPGPVVKDWDPYQVLPTLTQKTLSWLKAQDKQQPFFLYFALPAPHAPIIPNEEFVGTSQAGPYGDFVYQVDWVVGQVIKTLKQQGLEDDTLVIFTSDNGPERYAWARTEKYNHYSMGKLRGLKRDVWEGGHRVPMIVKWPGKVAQGKMSDEVVSQVDIMATIASLTNLELPEQAAPDSYDLTPVLFDQNYQSPLREATVHNTYAKKYALRQGDWLYINYQDGEHSKMSEAYKKAHGYQDFDTNHLLFNLANDLEQKHNLANKHPDKVKQMDKLLTQYREQGYSVKR